MKILSIIKIAIALTPMLCVSLNTQAGFSAFPLPQKKPLKNEHLISHQDIPLPTKKPQNGNSKSKTQNTSSRKLFDDDALRYQKIFELQQGGNFKEADRILREVEDERLLGHVLHQRYMHPTAYRSSFEELKYWLDLYSDHPDADKIFKMALSRKPKGYTGSIRKPTKIRSIARVHEPSVTRGETYKSSKVRTQSQRQKINKFLKLVKRQISRGAPTRALDLITNHKTAKVLDISEIGILRSEIAYSYFHSRKYKEALEQANISLKQARTAAPLAGWTAGLIYWREQNFKKAAETFQVTAKSRYASGWVRAAATFWSARSYMRLGDIKNVSFWLKQAHKHPRSFYGVLATRALGRNFDFNWELPNFTRKSFDILNKYDAGKRAIALVAAKQNHLAEKELLRLDIRKNEELRTALLAYANFANLPALSLRLGNLVSTGTQNKNMYDAALYPVGSWKYSDNDGVSPALLHAIMRQESKFNFSAENPSGARGLMQIMPQTASYITKDSSFKKGHAYKLFNPKTNIQVGEKYIHHLLNNYLIQGDLIKALVAYNAGAGNLKRWSNEFEEASDDPLLFIEMIPVAETRAYLERVLTNYWIYRERSHESSQTLEALAQGNWPNYALDDPKSTSFRLASQ